VQNANSTPFQITSGEGNPNPLDFSLSLGIETHMTNRALRALELFGSDESINAEEFQAYKYDMLYSSQSDMAKIMQRIVNGPMPEEPELRAAVELLSRWDLRTDPDNIGTALAVQLSSLWLDNWTRSRCPP
jgi:penicillin amidase/acyl-homoserine-lactone acylase